MLCHYTCQRAIKIANVKNFKQCLVRSGSVPLQRHYNQMLLGHTFFMNIPFICFKRSVHQSFAVERPFKKIETASKLSNQSLGQKMAVDVNLPAASIHQQQSLPLCVISFQHLLQQLIAAFKELI